MSTALTDNQKNRIYELWKENGYSKAQLARDYGVSARTIGRAIDKVESELGTDEVTATTQPNRDLEAPELQNVRENYDPTTEGEFVQDVQEPEDFDGVDSDLSETVKERFSLVDKGVKVHNWSISPEFVNMLLDNGDSISIDKSHESFEAVCDLVMENTEESLTEALALASLRERFRQFVYGHIQVEENRVLYKGRVVVNGVVEAIVSRFENGDSGFAKYVKFLDNLLKNPSYRCVKQLYPFIKHNDIEISDDGRIIAWKVVTSGYKDKHTNSIRNRIGDVVSMDRNEVDDDPNNTCSYGLHACARRYIGAFSSGGDKLMKVAVWPEHFVSCPTDYNGAKARVCQYEVIEEATE